MVLNFCGPCENRTRGSSVTGMNVSHYTNGPLKKVLNRPCTKPGEPFNFIYLVSLYPTPICPRFVGP